jgi:hypothetical protein
MYDGPCDSHGAKGQASKCQAVRSPDRKMEPIENGSQSRCNLNIERHRLQAREDCYVFVTALPTGLLHCFL